ncbi:MAG TPA: hypothetical protein VL171_04995 [Verrucomicrobiae bacterium]|nr:hypothetical protein [Verrucomicrobiae bacterium]
MALAAKPEWPQRYNAGVTAYESNDFAQAATSFETATASADRSLQQRALYNLGNTSYRLGQEQPAQAQQLWEHALKDYEGALALNPQDADAKFNRDFVKRKLEELKKQQQQQQQNQKNQQDKQKEQEKQQGQQKDQNQQQPNAKNQQSEQQKQQQAQEQQKQQEEQAKQQAATKPQQNPPEKGGQPENYEKMQATALLNDLRENERNWNFFPEAQMKDLKDSGKPAKDW